MVRTLVDTFSHFVMSDSCFQRHLIMCMNSEHLIVRRCRLQDLIAACTHSRKYHFWTFNPLDSKGNYSQSIIVKCIFLVLRIACFSTTIPYLWWNKVVYSATANNIKLVHGRWWVGCYIWHNEEGPGGGCLEGPPSPLLAVPNATAHPLTAGVPITVLLYMMVRCSAVLMWR